MENNPNQNIFNQAAPAQPASAPAPAPAPAQPTPAPVAAAPVQPGAAPAKKSIFAQAWFWVVISLVVLCIIGLVVFLAINSSKNNKAVAEYDAARKAAEEISLDFEGSFRTIYNEAGLSGYYSDSSDRPKELLGKCLDKFDVKTETFDKIQEHVLGEELRSKIGRKRLIEETDLLVKAADNLKNGKKNITKCNELLKESIYSDIDVKFGEFAYTQQSEYSYDTSMKITITNVSDTSHSFSFKVVAYDDNGDEIESNYVSTSTLSAGQKYNDTIFKYVSRSDIEKMKNARFEIENLSEF